MRCSKNLVSSQPNAKFLVLGVVYLWSIRTDNTKIACHGSAMSLCFTKLFTIWSLWVLVLKCKSRFKFHGDFLNSHTSSYGIDVGCNVSLKLLL